MRRSDNGKVIQFHLFQNNLRKVLILKLISTKFNRFIQIHSPRSARLSNYGFELLVTSFEKSRNTPICNCNMMGFETTYLNLPTQRLFANT